MVSDVPTLSFLSVGANFQIIWTTDVDEGWRYQVWNPIFPYSREAEAMKICVLAL